MQRLAFRRSVYATLETGLHLVAVVLLAWAMAALPLRWAVLLVVALAGGLALLRAPWLGLCLLGLTVPFGSLYEMPVGGLSVGPTELVLVASLVSFLLRGMVYRSFGPKAPRLWLAVALYTLLVALSLLRATSLWPAIKELTKWIEMVLLFWAASTLLQTESTRRWALISVLIGGALQALLGIYQFLFRVGPEGFVLFGRYMRAHGTFLQPNPYGGYLGLLLPLAYGTAWATGRAILRQRRGSLLPLFAVALTSGLLMAVALVMSWSRGALLGVAGGLLLVMLWALRRSPWVVGLLLGLALVVGPLAGALLPESYLTRFAGQMEYVGQDLRLVEIDDDNFATIERLAHWQAAWRMFERAPWLGVGAGQYPVVYPQVALPRWQDPLGHAHNYYLNTLAEQGLVGLTAFGLLCLAIILALWRNLARQSSLGLGLGLGALGMWGHLLAHSLVDNLFVHEMYLTMALLIGAALAKTATAEDDNSAIGMERAL